MFPFLQKILNKNKTAKQSTKPLDLEDKIEYAKFEIWEILTFLTAVFTLASVMVWFSGFYPKHSEDEFLFLDKQKSLIYNEFLQAQKVLKTDLNYLKSEDGLTKISELDKSLFRIENVSEYREVIKEVDNYSQKNSLILRSLQKETGFLSQSKILIGVSEEYGKYLLNEKNNQEKLYSSSQKIANLREAFLSLILDGEGEKSEDNLKVVKQIYDNIRLHNLISNPEFNLKIKTFLADYEKGSALDVNSKEFQDFFIYLLSLKTSDLKIQTALNEADFIAKIKEFETWQKEFLATNQSIRDRVVWIKI